MLAGPELKAIHPLGKSPVISIQAPLQETPHTIAESGAIVEYLCTHFGKHLIPTQYKEGEEGKIGGETEEWMRYRFYMHYAEGSLMPLMVMTLLVNSKFFCPYSDGMVTPVFIPEGANTLLSIHLSIHIFSAKKNGA